MGFNKEQQAAIDAKVYENVQIAAGAGSGKTKTLSAKVLDMVKRGEIEPSDLLVLTFTNNAAHEMKERIIKAFADNGDAVNKIKILSSHVQTFDSFAQYLVKTYAKELGIASNISVANEDVIETKKNLILDEILEEYYSDEEKRKEILKTLVKFNLDDDRKTKQVILDLCSKLDNMIYEDRIDFIDNYEEKYLSREVFDKEIDEFVSSLKDKIILGMSEAFFLEKNFSNIDDYKYTKSLFLNNMSFSTDYKSFSFSDEIYCQPFFEEYLHLLSLDNESFISATKSFKTNIKNNHKPDLFGGRSTSTAFKDNAAQYSAYTALKDINNDILIAASLESDLNIEFDKMSSFKDDIKLYLNIVKELNKRLGEYKRISNCYSFGDISEMAYRLLTEEKYQNVAKEIRNKFKYLMVDEYQDTNDIQEGVINSLLKEKEDGSRSHLFCVGDAKQSIYGFRNSKVELFRNRQAQYQNSSDPNEHVIPMNTNYRSAKQVLLDINTIFNKYMTLDHGGISYLDPIEQLTYDEKVDLYGKEHCSSPFGIFRLTSVNGFNDGYHAKYWEIMAIINDIKKKTAPDSDFRVYDRDSNPHVRRAKYSDFVILMRTKSGFDAYQKEFNDHGIPLNNKLSTHLRELDAILLIQSLVSMINYKINGGENVDVKHLFASISRSYIYQYSDQQIYDLISKDIESLEEDQVMKDIDDFINNYYGLPFSDIFLHMITDFNIVSKLNLVGDIDDNISKIESLYSILISQESAGEGLKEFVKLFKDISKYDLDLTADSTFQVEDAVDMMTIHASKGLERKIVYMPYSYNKLTKENSLGAPDYKFSEKYGIMLPHYVIDEENPIYTKTISNVLYNQEKDIKNPEIDEHVRLFYVALTRAENRLVIVGDGPDFLSKEDEKIKKKEDLYSMLSYIPYYFKLNRDYLLSKVKEGVIHEGDIYSYDQIVDDIKKVNAPLSPLAFNDEITYKNYSTLYKKYYVNKLTFKMQEAVYNMRKEIFLNHIKTLQSLNENDQIYLDYASKFLAFIMYHKQIQTFDEFLEVIKEDEFNKLEAEIESLEENEEEENAINIDEDTSIDTSNDERDDNGFQLYIEINSDNVKMVAIDVLRELVEVATSKKESEIFNVPKSISTKDNERVKRLVNNVGVYLSYAIDNVESFATLSFESDNFKDQIETFDIEEFLTQIKEEDLSSVSLGDSLNTNNDHIEFATRIKKKASKVVIDEDLELKQLFSFGTYIHNLLELVDLKNINLDYIKNVKEREMINNVLNNDLMKLARSADKIYQEYGYYDELNSTNGFIDLFFIKDGEYYIVDYKSKHTEDDGYVEQLHSYQKNIQALFKIDKSKIHLYLISIINNEIVPLECE